MATYVCFICQIWIDIPDGEMYQSDKKGQTEVRQYLHFYMYVKILHLLFTNCQITSDTMVRQLFSADH